MATYAELLTAVDAAITGTLSRGQKSYSINGRSITSFDLDELWKLKQNLEQAAAVEAGTVSHRPSVVRFREPS